MQRRLHILGCILLMLVIGSVDIFAQKSSAKQQTYVDGVVRVKLQREVAARMATLPMGRTRAGGVKVGVRQLDAAAEKVGVVRMTRVFPYAGKYEEKHKKYGLDLWYDVEFDSKSMTTMQVKNLYKTVAGVEKAQRVPIYRTIDDGKAVVVTAEQMAKAAQAARANASLPFNDPLLGNQWHYQNDGKVNGMKSGADINLFKAWETGIYGAKDVVVAIVDGGFDTTHPDLKDNLWINQAELNGKPGVDDDGDGYVDDVYGYNFVINSSNINAHEHGTHVAGTVGATNGNGLGVGGVAGGKDGQGGVKMMVCQIFDSRASKEGNNAAALVYAADNGAAIAQCSWGYSSPDVTDDATAEAVRYFTKEGGGDKMNGGLCIFASGNNGDEGEYFPGNMDEVVAVGSMGADGYVTTYSNYGNWVDVTAPGGNLDSGQSFGVLSTLPDAKYGYMEGTSMACPHVSGVAALILSKYGNKNFSNETLRTLLTTSVNDLYTQNPDYVGKMGTGYIDAFKALQGKEGSTPDGVKEFTLTPSHDNILIEWTIPECEEKSIDHHVVYYSTEAFTAESDLSKVNRVSVDTKFMNSGDKMAYELKNVKASTKYYIAIVAYSRWGKASEMSPVKEATTNAGPVASVDKKTLSMTINAASSPVAETSFNLKNKGEGLLKYELTAATAKATYSTMSRNAKPNPGQVVAFSGTMRTDAAKSYETVTADYQVADYPKNLTFAKSIYAYLGESDLSLPNAMAQYLWVDPDQYPDGFNLTHLRIDGAYGENPEIEIYDGSRSISVASLMQKVDYDFFSYGYDIALKEQMHFAPNTAFWVVVKFPANYKNPLGASSTDGTDYSQYSYYSSDNGATWVQLKEVLKGSSFENVASQLTWAITAISKNPDWSDVLNPEPIQGEIRPGQSQKVTLKNDGQKLVNGTYTFNIHVKTNEAVDSKQKVTLTMKVNGYKPEMRAPKLVDFGNLLIGQSKTIEVELANAGFGAFTGNYGSGFYAPTGLKISSDQFKADEGAPAVPARASRTMRLTFQPTQEGSFSATVTLTDKDGNKCSFVATGVAAVPATLEVDKTEFDMGDLKEGDVKTATVTLKNTGKYPLQYVFPKFSSENIEGSTARVHKFGYTALSNVAGANDMEYQPVPELADEKDITNEFSDGKWFSSPIDLGFKFPFYGKDYEQVYVCSYGGVSMKPLQDGRHFSCIVPEADCVDGIGYISGFSNSGWLTIGTNTKISVGHKDGKLYVKFQNVQCPTVDGGNDRMSLSYHMVLCPDGSTEIYYDDYDPTYTFCSGANNFVGVVDVESTDPFVFVDTNSHEGNSWERSYYDIATGSAIKLVAPAKSMIKSLSEADGYVGIGESKDVTVTVAPNADLYAGELVNYLTVITNDPNHASQNFAFKANIVGDDLKPEAKYTETAVDFGNVFRTSYQIHNVLLHNNGKDVLNVASVTVKGGKFTVADDAKDGFAVPAGQGKDITVILPTETEGEVEDVLVVTYQDGTTHEIALKGKVIGVPAIAVNPEMIEATTPYGVNVDTSIKVSNEGNETLEFTPQSAEWYHLSDVEADGENTKVDYTFKSKSDSEGVTYDWKDITKDYTEHMPFSYFIDKTDFKKVTLPFEFPFYGKKYKEMYIYNTGFVSFDAPVEDYKIFPEPPTQLPTTETFYTNIICPFWGNHSMNTPSSDGVFYKENGDEVIVSYKNYGNSMMIGMNFQVIIRKDGTFKFQYNLDDDGMMVGVFGLAGIMDNTGTRGMVTPDAYINSGNAVEFAPVKSYAVAAGQTVDVPVQLHADQLADDYYYEMNLKTNVPHNEMVSVPVSLNITGDVDPVFPETVTVEQTIDPYGMPAVQEFTVENKGNRAFYITNIVSPMMDTPEDDPWGMPAGMLEVYMSTGDNGGDPDPGPLADDAQMAWMPYYSYMMAPIQVGKEPVKFRITTYNTYEPWQGEFPMYFEVQGLAEEMVQTNVKMNITDAPVLVFDQEELRVESYSKDFDGTATVNMMNAGAYKLTYSLRLDASGKDEETEEDDWGGADPMLKMMAKELNRENAKRVLEMSAWKVETAQMLKAMGVKTSSKDDQKYYMDIPEGFTGNAIYYPVLNPVSNAIAAVMGTGSENLDDNFYAATRYEAPEEGFNLTHLYFTGTIGTLQNVDIEAYVVLGNDVSATEKTIGHGKIRVESEEKNKNGMYLGVPRMLEFDHPMYINPNDTFYVVLKYPAGYGSSALMASKDGDKEPNRYMGNSKALGGWLDLEETFDEYYSYGSFGYFMTCIEKEKGEPWIKLLNEKSEGEIAPEGVLPVTFKFNPNGAYFAKNNKATLVVKTNDPMQKTVNYHIYLDKNDAPVVEATEATISVLEGEKAVVPVVIGDVEGDAFTAKLTDASGIASVVSYSNEEETQDGIKLENGVYSVEAGRMLMLNVQLAPEHGDRGYHAFQITVADTDNNQRTATVNYQVDYVNQAPQYVGPTNKLLLSSSAENILYNDLFNDPDGDELTGAVTVSNSDIVEVFTSTDGFVIKPKMGGKTVLQITATDPKGASATGTMSITVLGPGTGIDDVNAGSTAVAVDGTVEGGNVGVTFGTDADRVTLAVYDTAGQLKAQKSLRNVHAGDKVDVELGYVAAGVYHLVANIDGKVTNVKFITK